MKLVIHRSHMLLAIAGGLSLGVISFTEAAGLVPTQHMQFSSQTFLDYELKGGTGPPRPTGSPTTMAPSVSSAPTASKAPSSPPTVSLVPSDNPTDSPAPSPSPSEAPTIAPTSTPAPTAAPSDNPTESPAPSPSPSQAPTNAPTVSTAPSFAPTLSSAPSDQPSSVPTPVPSAFPSDSPSFTPTLSVMPSATPSAVPTDVPSAIPSDTPSDVPSFSPSARPSGSPSSSPSMAPSVSMAPSTSEPSSAPSGAPTEEEFKTKTGITTVFLEDVEREMTNSALGQFELTTLEFVRDTQTSTPGFSVDILAVTVLGQNVVYPEPPNDGETENNASTVGLQVSFRTVGVVTEGTAPRDLDFTTVTDAGFEYYFGEYLHRLTLVDPFFEVLAQHVDTTSLIPVPDRVQPDLDEEDPRNHAQFVAAIFFATLALLIAISATIYAVRKHLRKQREEKMQELEHTGPTKTMSNDPESPRGQNFLRDDDMSDLSATQAAPKSPFTQRMQQVVGTTSNPLQLNIGDENIEMEDVGLTPMSLPSGYRGFSSTKKPPRVPVSPNAMERGTSIQEEPVGTTNKRSSFGRAFGMKKWLTPRKGDKTSTIDLSDPPSEKETGFDTGDQKSVNNVQANRTSMEPDAAMASTRNAPGIWAENNQVGSPAKNNKSTPKENNSPLGIPARFFGRSTSDARSDATSNNMDSMIGGSTASSFFTNLAGRKGSTFTGQKNNNNNNAPRSETTGSNAAASYKFGSTNGGGKDPFLMSDHNFTLLRTNSNDNVEASIAGMSDFEKKRSVFESSKRITRNNNHTSELVLEDRDDSPVHELEPKRTRTFEADSVYSEQSELDLNELGVETTLGALPPRYDESDTPVSRDSVGSFVGHQYGSRPITSTTTASNNNNNNKFSAGNNKPSVTLLGAKAMAAEEEKRRMSLNTAIQQGDTYDVFAPPGPIGIVVDTSKMGPAVHSLKSTSPMLGLINPGDLIIALDDEDTRNLTAASLTRLMAKKSRQKERKITLLAPDGF